MNDDQLKKKLSVLKSTSVPRGYWAGYWPRLKEKLGRVQPEREPVRTNRHWRLIDFSFPGVLVPVFSLVAIAIGFYRLGLNSAAPLMSSPDIHLASDNGETQAQTVFKQMLDLFPKRVNWISFVGGKVDFSISSVAYADTQVLVPLIVTLPRAKEPFETRFLIRPGQSAHVEGVWDKKTAAMIRIQLSADGRKAIVSCHLNGSGLETEIDISKEGLQPLGSFRSGERLVQAQLTRVKK